MLPAPPPSRPPPTPPPPPWAEEVGISIVLWGMVGINTLIVGCALAMACISFLKRPRVRAETLKFLTAYSSLGYATKSKSDASAPEPAPSQPPIDLTTVSEVELQLDSLAQGKQTPVNDRLPQYDSVATEAAAAGVGLEGAAVSPAAAPADVGTPEAVTSSATMDAVDSSTEYSPEPTKHTVQRTDTLQGLALRYSVQSSAILRANRLGSAAALHGLKEIIIPPKARSPSLEKVAYQI